jgi:hypothetical protein
MRGVVNVIVKQGPKIGMADAESLELFSACLASRRFMRSAYLIQILLAERQYRENRRPVRELLYFCAPSGALLRA